MKRALVTGSSGFVGRHIAAALSVAGYTVTGIDIRPGRWTNFRMDANAGLASIGNNLHFDLAVHCAAVVGGRTMIDGRPLELAVEDLRLDSGFVHWAMTARPGKVVLFSSSAAYPVYYQREEAVRLMGARGVRLDERLIDVSNQLGSVMMPDQTYGWVKLTLERLALELRSFVPTYVFRPFSGYGADQDLDYPFPAIVRRAGLHKQGEPFKVWGPYDSARDWIHIDDVVVCVLAHLAAEEQGPVNICTGRATTFGELATLALAAFGKHADIIGDLNAPTGVFWRVGDPREMEKVYVPTITIEEGIRRAATAGLDSTR